MEVFISWVTWVDSLPTWLDQVVLLCKTLICILGQQADVLSKGEAEAAKHAKDTDNRSLTKDNPYHS
jgi:hypothetical protein